MINRKSMERDVMHTIYQVMLKRISKNYSAEELSFLMGYPPDFIGNVESLQGMGYGPKAIKRIAKALEEKNLNSFYCEEDVFGLCDVEMERIDEGGVLIHRCTVYQGETGIPSFLLNEIVSDQQKSVATDDPYYLMAKNCIKLLLDSGYFYVAKSNQQIFKRINRFLLTGTLSPAIVAQALQEMCDEETGGLKRITLDGKEGTFVEC
jgi:hypothetical protein